MGNTENEICQNYYFCHMRSNQEHKIRKSISLSKKSMEVKSEPIISDNFDNIGQLENGAKLIDERYNNNNSDNISHKKDELNPNLRNNYKNEIESNYSKKSIRNDENKKNNVHSRCNSSLNINKKRKIFFISELEQCSNIEKNKNVNMNKEDNYELKKVNISTDEEDTIINTSLSESSFKSSDLKKIQNKNNSINVKKQKVQFLDFNKNEKIVYMNTIREKKENEFTEIENILSEKEIDSEDFKDLNDIFIQRDKNDLIKSLKATHFRYSIDSIIKKEYLGKNKTLKYRNKLQDDKSEKAKKDTNINSSNLSIPETRHLLPDHPLNFLIIKRRIKTSLFPLYKDSFNILIYKEDNSQQYSFFKNGIPNGVTKFILDKKKNIIYEGEYENGYPKGYGLYSVESEGRYFEGIWDKQFQIGIITYSDGTIYMGEFKNNKREGIGKYRWPDGTLYLGEWKNDNMNGFCFIKYNDDRRYEGQMKNGLKEGYGEFTWKPTRKYIGNYSNDLKSGFGIYIWNINIFRVYIGFWHQGRMEGVGVVINGSKLQYGKWLKGQKVERFKNAKQLKLKYKHMELNVGNKIIRRRSVIIQDSLIRFDKKCSIKEDRKSIVNKAKNELEGWINFMCQDIKTIKNYIINIFNKTNESYL